ncbi:MAG: class I SAM-dependent methyltransferase [Anaerolineae bacterium]|jgi:SAM-dependent methyltransferase
MDYNATVNDATVERLLALNRKFYATFAQHFAASRPVSDPALTSILPYLSRGARVLDVGCGNGRLALLLDQERPGSIYVGVDAVPELIGEAQARADQLVHTDATYRVLDITRRGWTQEVPATSSATPVGTGFDCVVALAVLHHIPGFDLRARVLRDVGGLLKPEGYVILSTWRFLAHERLRRKIVGWDEVGIGEDELDPGDYLLDWKRGGRGLRYCHLMEEDEVEQLAAASGLTVRETFRAGGREGDVSLFAILDRTQPQ